MDWRRLCAVLVDYDYDTLKGRTIMDEEPKKLTRSKNDATDPGVCAGLGEYFNVDPTLVRIPLLCSRWQVGLGYRLHYLWLVVPKAE